MATADPLDPTRLAEEIAARLEPLTQSLEALFDNLAWQLESRPLYSPKMLAERLSVSERTVRDMLAAETIPSFKVEGARRIDPVAVDAYLAARRPTAKDEHREPGEGGMQKP